MSQQATNDVPTLKEKVTFEQGQYLRDGGGPNLTKYDYWVRKHKTEIALVGGVGASALAIYFSGGLAVIPEIADGFFVVGSVAASGVALLISKVITPKGD